MGDTPSHGLEVALSQSSTMSADDSETDPWLSRSNTWPSRLNIDTNINSWSALRVAVIGHVEWTRIACVDRVPVAGDVTHADLVWEGAAGGGAVAAVQLAKLAGRCAFFTALGDDATGRKSRAELESQGVEVFAALREQPTREAVSLVDATGERTTVTIGQRLQPCPDDPLPWDMFADYHAIYFAAGDPDVLRWARSAGKLVVTCRELLTAAAAAVPLDALIGSARDSAERYNPDLLSPPPSLIVSTDGEAGGHYSLPGSPACAYPPMPPPSPMVDSYGVGDSFAAALTFGLAAFADVRDALALAAQCGAASVAGLGPYAGQMGFVKQSGCGES
jgi:ribokinase